MSQGCAGVSLVQRSLRLLIVEDNAVDAELIVATLKRAGYPIDFHLVDAAEEFEQLLRTESFDLILCDHNLRTWTGMHALESVRRSAKDTPFVVVTAALGDEAAVEYVKHGAADYVLKHRLERLPAVVSRALREKAHREEAARLHDVIVSAKREWEITFDTVPDGILILDRELNILRANRAATRIFARDFSQIIGRRCCEVVHGTAQTYPQCPFQRMLVTGVEERADIDEPHVGRVLDISTTPIRDASGALVGGIEVIRDITSRKRAEEALRESELRYRELFQNATLGMFRATVDGRFLDVNPALVHMLGYDSREELMSVNLATGVYCNPQDRERLIQFCIENRIAESTEVEWNRKDGKSIIVRLAGHALRSPGGEVLYFEDFVEDITERLALEKQFYAAQKFEAIGQLAGGIAHDFNNVLGAILGWAELSEPLVAPDSKLHKALHVIMDQARRASGLTRQLLAFARRQHIEPQILNLNASVEEAVSLLAKVIGSDVEMRTALAENLASIRADPTQIQQVLMNLCVNARDAMSQGGKLIVETCNAEIDEDYCRRHPYARPGSYVQLSVSDTGAGMEPAIKEHIFEPFFTTKEVGKGTGLGLSTVYGVVKQHGGFIHVYSEPGQGTTFRVYFPARTESAQTEKEKEVTPVSGGSETILLAEDSDDLASLAREALEARGYAVLRARDGEEAVQLFEANRDRVALLLLDVVMPRLNGPEAFLKISALRNGIPALFTSGHAFDAPALKSLLERGGQVLQKPYSVADLLRKIRAVLDAAAKPS